MIGIDSNDTFYPDILRYETKTQLISGRYVSDSSRLYLNPVWLGLNSAHFAVRQCKQMNSLLNRVTRPVSISYV